MNSAFTQLAVTHQNLSQYLTQFDLEKLRTIPPGFNNHIFWNIAHCVVTQQLLCYRLSGNDLLLEDSIIDLYRKGSSATPNLTTEDIADFKNYLEVFPQKLKEDYEKGLFKSYTRYPTSYGFELNSIEDAISFNNIHSGVHLGYIMAMRKSL